MSKYSLIKWKYLAKENMMYGANESAEHDDMSYPRYIRITDLDNEGNLKEDTFKSLPPQIAAPYLLSEGDILLARSGATVGKAYIHKGDLNACFAGYLIKFSSRKDLVNPKFVFYYTQTKYYASWIAENTIQATIQNVSAEKYANLQMPLPSLDIQDEIVKYLDMKVDDLNITVSSKERLLYLLEEKRQSIITEAVTKGLNPNVKMKDSGVEWIGEIPEHWEVKKVKHFSKLVGSGKTPSGGSEVYLDEGIPFLRSLNVHFEGIRLKNLAFISEEIDNEMRSTRIQPLDNLLNITGASIGRSCIVPKDFGRGNVNQHVCIIRVNQNKINPYYFNSIMNSKMAMDQIMTAQTGSSREGLNFQQVKNLMFPVAPLEEQEELNRFIFTKQKEIYNVINRIESQIQKLKEYRQSLIYEAVTGKLDVRELIAEK
ncbi:restriction endonuclease subunit S [Planococcus sp. YIM B11945]|uniref:restriction endonuclease subunit S n=1 Tax=Planococcus sp. YIM B11945 TaxID=3435410 RepID=UPI003D7E1CF5